MEVVLIQGEENTGKTTLCKMIEDCLIQNNFKEQDRRSRPECGLEQDFTVLYEKDGCRIIINSESEKGGSDRFDDFYKKHSPYGDCDIIITAIRPKNTNPNLHKWIKDVYKSDFKGEEYVIDLDTERNNEENVDLDFCEFIKKVLEERGGEILKKIKTKLECKIEISINCP